MNEDEYPELEVRLKSILQICVELIKPKLKTKAQAAELQDLLVDYQNNDQLAEVIQNVVKLVQKIITKSAAEQSKPMVEEQQYIKLEQAVQNLQAKQRSYIKSENQLKLYCQELEAKNKQLQQSKNELVVSTKKVILDLKRDNQSLVEKIKALTAARQLNNEKAQAHKMKNNGSEIFQKLPKDIKGSEKAENSLKSKLQQYHEVIQSIEVARGKRNSHGEIKDKHNNEIK